MNKSNSRRKLSVLIAGILAVGSITFPPSGLATATAEPITVYEGEQWKFEIDIDPEVLKEIGKRAWNAGKKVYTRVFTDHPERKIVVDVSGHKVVFVRITSEAGGTRLTNNINFKDVWERDPDVRIFVATSKGDPNAMAFQLKKDVNWGGDKNKSDNNLRHGVRIKKFSAGNRRYFANRSDTVYWGGWLVIAEAALSKDDIDGIRGVSIK